MATKNGKYTAKIEGVTYVIHFLTNSNQVEITGESGKTLTLKLSELVDLINTKETPSGANAKISAHNTNAAAHQDIRSNLSSTESKAQESLNKANAALSSTGTLNDWRAEMENIILPEIENHATLTNNPHKTNKSDVGLGNVTNDAQVKRSEMGVANGVATLDGTGKVPTSQLPSYVDDVKEYNSKSAFPTTGETDKIYVAKDSNIIYRWSGTAYVEISSSLALGETSSTAYAGDRGKQIYDVVFDGVDGLQSIATAFRFHTKSDNANPHNITKNTISLGNVTNDAQVKRSEMGVANGVATLGSDGLVVQAAKQAQLAEDYVRAQGSPLNDKFVSLESSIASKQSQIVFTSVEGTEPASNGGVVIIYA